MTFEEWYEQQMMESSDCGPKDLAKAAWDASIESQKKLNTP